VLDCGERMSTKTTPWSTYSSGKLYVTLHDSHAFGVYSTEIPRGGNVSGGNGKGKLESHARILKEVDEEGLCRLLQGQYGRALPAQGGLARLIVGVGHHIQGDFANLYVRPVVSARGRRETEG